MSENASAETDGQAQREESIAVIAGREFNVAPEDAQQSHKAVNATLRRMIISYNMKNSQEGVDSTWEEINALRTKYPGYLERIRAHYKVDVEDGWWEREHAADSAEMEKRRAATAAAAPQEAPQETG